MGTKRKSALFSPERAPEQTGGLTRIGNKHISRKKEQKGQGISDEGAKAKGGQKRLVRKDP